MITVPVSTPEKPLTAVDFCAALEQCTSVSEIQQFSDQVPIDILNDERYSRAVAQRLSAINAKRRASA